MNFCKMLAFFFVAFAGFALQAKDSTREPAVSHPQKYCGVFQREDQALVIEDIKSPDHSGFRSVNISDSQLEMIKSKKNLSHGDCICMIATLLSPQAFGFRSLDESTIQVRNSDANECKSILDKTGDLLEGN
jgi:hypothetical protein